MDQPAWTWDLMTVAGNEFEQLEEHNQRVEALLREQQENAKANQTKDPTLP